MTQRKFNRSCGDVIQVVLVCLMAHVPSFAQPSPVHLDPSAVLLRVLHYEAILGDELAPETGLCVDAEMSEISLEFDQEEIAFSARTNQQVQRAAELCAVYKRDIATRLIGQKASKLQEQILLFSPMLRQGRICLADPATLGSLQACVKRTTGLTPSPAELQQWTAVFQQWRKR